jgi:very-short-patch-repair endonuclease
MTVAERQAQVAAANVAATGRQKTFAEQCLAAQTRQERRSHASTYEGTLERLLAERGIAIVPQCAIGPYNCDLGAYPVAVEIFGGHWHWHGYHLRVAEKRLNYLLNAGWHVLAILVNKTFPITDATAEYVAAYIESARGDPARRREYRVIRGAGELIAAGSVDDEKISIVPTFTSGRNALGQYTRVPRQAPIV